MGRTLTTLERFLDLCAGTDNKHARYFKAKNTHNFTSTLIQRLSEREQVQTSRWVGDCKHWSRYRNTHFRTEKQFITEENSGSGHFTQHLQEAKRQYLSQS